MPSEAEWEYAARSGGQDVTYPWGNDPATCTYAVMWDRGRNGCTMGRAWPVCSIVVLGNTEQGLCDMAGNTAEWVQDEYHVDYTDAPADGSSWESPGATARVMRGGSYRAGDTSLQATYRFFADPPNGTDDVGVRCVRSAP